MRILVIWGVLGLSAVASAAKTPFLLTCVENATSDDIIVSISNNNDSMSLIESRETFRDGEVVSKSDKTIGKTIKIQKTSKADIYNAVDETGKTVVTLKHDGNPVNFSAQGSNGKAQFFCSFNQPLMSYEAPKTRGEFCAIAGSPGRVQNLLKDPENRLAFTNGPYGLARGGVCWWHSMFERNAAYMAIFQPKAAKPDRATGQTIINAIRAGNQIVVVPGYKNLKAFSADYVDEIIKTLESWQVADAVGFAWIRGLSGAEQVPPAQLRKIMDDTYQVVEEQKQVAFHMLQMPGVAAHAWLVVGMKKVTNGYDLLVDDSNYLGNRVIQYRNGMTKLREYNAVPYLQTKYLRDTTSMIAIERNYCSGSNVVSR